MYALALLIGIVAGLRTLTAPTGISWAAWSGRGLLAGIVGAVIGALGGHAFRLRLAGVFKKDWPAAVIEDAIAVGGALSIVEALP